MKKPSSFIIHNLWWLSPLLVILIFWQHTLPIIFMLIVAYIGRIVLNPVVNWVGGLVKNRSLSVGITTLGVLLLFLLLWGSLWPVLSEQLKALQSFLTMESFYRLQDKSLFIAEKILPVTLFEFFSSTLFSQFQS